MLKTSLFGSLFFLSLSNCFPQLDVGGMMKDKANEAKDKAREKAREKAMQNFEKQKKEYDESNFNYAICFLDNSGVFEADEKGNSLNSLLLSGRKICQQ